MLITGEKDPKYTIECVKSTLNILTNKVKAGKKPGHTYYYMYYASVCAYASGDKVYGNWIKQAEPFLIKLARGKKWTGKPYQAAFAVLAAALPYRYLPIYQR